MGKSTLVLIETVCLVWLLNQCAPVGPRIVEYKGQLLRCRPTWFWATNWIECRDVKGEKVPL